MKITLAKTHLTNLDGWKITSDHAWIFKEFIFENFLAVLEFINKIAVIAEEQNHHPNIEMTWGYCKISIQNHQIKGLCKNDFILAAKIDQIFKNAFSYSN